LAPDKGCRQPLIWIQPEDLAVLKKAAEQPQGMILVTGRREAARPPLFIPLSMKRKTLHQHCDHRRPHRNPIARHNQVQVNVKSGMTFAASMRSLLRQDPDVILLGEIRDSETQEIAFSRLLPDTWCCPLFTPTARQAQSPGCWTWA